MPRRPTSWITVEKILEPGEHLPDDWPVDGTTGYDSMRLITGLFVDPSGRDELDDGSDITTVVDDAKRDVLERVLAADVERLVRIALHIATGDAALVEFGEDRLARRDLAPRAGDARVPHLRHPAAASHSGPRHHRAGDAPCS